MPSPRMSVLSAWIFGTALVAGLLPSAPGIDQTSTLLHVPPQGPLILLWVMLTAVTGRRTGRGLVTAVLLSVIGLWSVAAGDASLRVWAGALVLPLALFVALQWTEPERLPGLRLATKVSLLVVLAWQVTTLLLHQGPSAFTWSVAYRHHTDQAYWAEVGGQVLGNPNNASVVYCTALAWGVAGLALGGRRSVNLVLCALSVACIVATGSRGAVLTAVVVLVMTALLLAGRRAVKPLAALVAAAAAFLVVEGVFAPLGLFSEGLVSSVSHRSETRVAALPDVFTRPLGTGAGTTDVTLKEEMYEVLGWDSVGATSHDVFLNWGVALGWVGLAILLVALLRAALRGHVAAGWLGLLPLAAFVVSAQSAGIDLLNATNPAWALLFWVLVGLAWRGGVVAPRTAGAHVRTPEAVDGEVDRADHVLQLTRRAAARVRARRAD